MSRRSTEHGNRRERGGDQSDSATMHNRLFILGAKNASEDEFRDEFNKYGTVEDVWSVTDKKTGESKGVTYVTMSKTSEACLALEEMNGRCLPGYPKPLKVMIAADREQGNMREEKEEEKLLRIFIKVPKDQTDEDVESCFKEWGNIDYVSVLKDKSSGVSKGLAYVKYFRAYCAAKAVEECDPDYKAVFAKKKQQPQQHRDKFDDYQQPVEYRGGSARSFRSNYVDSYDIPHSSRAISGGPMDMLADIPHTNQTKLEAMASTAASREQIYRLFDLIPGLEYCDFDRHSGMAYIQYSHPQCASYAREKMNGIEYPPGFRISVRYSMDNKYASNNFADFERNDQGRGFAIGGGFSDNFGRSNNYNRGYEMDEDPSNYGSSGSRGPINEITSTLNNLASNPSIQGNDVLQTLVETMSKATSMLQKTGGSDGGQVRTNYCNILLPPKAPLASKDEEVVERLFVVSQPSKFPDNIMRDVFSRFGGLIDAHFMNGRNCGYAKYTNKESASNAIATLHAQEICGMRLKVMLADPPKNDQNGSNKRGRYN